MATDFLTLKSMRDHLWLGYMLLLGAWITFFVWLNESPHWTSIFSQLNVSLWAIFILGVLFLGLNQLPLAWQAPNKRGDSSKPQNYLTHLFAVSLPLILFWLLYHQVLNAWWEFDDPAILHYVETIGPFASFFDPQQKFNHFYTPLQHLSLGIDYEFFGLTPAGFYWHHLLSLSAVILLAYAVLSLFFAPLLASMIVSLFIVSVPTAQVTHYLMVRHYVEGLALSLIAVWVYVQAVKQERWTWAVLGSLFYLLATLAKELYVPLVIALAWLPIGIVKTRIRLLIPYIVVAILYTLLRFYMLGEHVFSSYIQTTTWQNILNFPATFLNIMGWDALWQWLPLLGLVIIFGIALWRKSLFLGLSSLVWISMAFIPLIPIIWKIATFYYYLFVFGLLFFVGYGIAFNHLGELLAHSVWRNLIIMGWFLILLLANLLPVQTEQLRMQTLMQARKIQGEFLMYSNSSSTVLIYDYDFAPNLIYLRDKVLAQTNGVNWCLKDDCLCAIHYPGYTAKQYVNGQWQTKRLSNQGACEKIRELSVVLTLTPPNQVTWHLGPYSYNQGQYYVSTSLDAYGQSSSRPTFYRIMPQGTHTFFGRPLLKPLTLIVKYESSEGWQTYSPRLVLDPKPVNEQGLVKVVWQRGERLKPEKTP